MCSDMLLSVTWNQGHVVVTRCRLEMVRVPEPDSCVVLQVTRSNLVQYQRVCDTNTELRGKGTAVPGEEVDEGNK